MFKFLGKIFDFIRTIFNILTFRADWGERVVKEHPKLNRFYEKGFGARFLLFFVSLIIVAVLVAIQFMFWYGIFDGGWIYLLILIPILMLFGIPIKFLGNLCGIGFYHFGTGLERGIKKLKTKIKKSNEEQETPQTTDATEVTVKGNNNEVVNDQSAGESKPKTRSFASLIFFIFEGIFTLGSALSIFIIPFTAAAWL